MTTFYIKTKTAIVFFLLPAVLATMVPYSTPAGEAAEALLNIVSFFFLTVLMFKGIKALYGRFKTF